MSNSDPSGSAAALRDDYFAALADARRRTVLRLVCDRSPQGVEKDDLAFHLAAVTSDKRLASVTDDDHQRALVDLHHRLLPRLTDAGLLEETDDELIRIADTPAFDGFDLEAAVSSRRTDDVAELDAVFAALADDRRRTVLAVLSDQYHPIATETLARDVAAREADVSQREVSQERVDEVRVSLVHVHLPQLCEATLVGYDEADETKRVSYEGHPAVRAEWIQPADSALATTGSTGTDAATDVDAPVNGTAETDVRTLEGRDTIIATGQSLCERAEDELFLMFTTTGLLEEGCFRQIEDAVDRGVDVYLGSRDPRVRELVGERVPEVVLWEPQLDWLNLPPEGESVGRLVFADREAIMLGTLGQPLADDGEYAETAILGEGPHNGLVVLMRQMLGSRLDELDARSMDRRSQLPL
ncbi:DUF7344 domain-containing protein [Natrinema versiforme]|uniref:DUF7344 domain-containing protein n=1 Tax=Natrinema versiforme JCM 10478 TaxID=1227496 RepID=L9Y6N2_9EURY|nr:hypothetical protein [Natrinema versiforme]ELY69311.1 hypothetical protein C489_05138 [Natrinema versiforme JCM 10478]